jgi:hypothetical protein
VLCSGLGGGDCGVDFKPGQEYLAFAHRAGQSGRWVARSAYDKDGHSGIQRGLAGAQLRLYSNGYELRTVSHSGGRFRFDTVPPGRYRIHVRLPGWQLLNAPSGDEEVELSHAGCAEILIMMLEPAPKSKQ